jgi:hypothetical protein
MRLWGFQVFMKPKLNQPNLEFGYRLLVIFPLAPNEILLINQFTLCSIEISTLVTFPEKSCLTLATEND